MSIETRVDGSPEACRAAAKEVRALRDEVSQSCNVLARSRSVAGGAWSGAAAEAFRDEAALKARRGDEFTGVLGGLAADLDGLADALESIDAEMTRARGVAAAAKVPVTGTLIAERGEFEVLPEQEAPLDHVVGIVTRARERESTLQENWAKSLEPVIAFEWDFDLAGALQGSPGIATGPKRMLRTPPDLDDLPRPSKEHLLALAPMPGLLVDLPKGARWPGAVGNMKIIVDSTEKQMERDKGRSDLTPLEKRVRGVVRGTLNIGGGAAGAVLVGSRGAISIRALLLGEAKGRKLGDKAADLLLGAVDAF